MKFTKEDFIKKAETIYGKFYSFDKTVWVNARTKFIVTCKNCGDLTKDYNHFIIRKQGCPCRKSFNLSLEGTNNYKEAYNTLIENAKKENRKKGEKYYEEHHILPKSLGGSNSKENLILLTPEEHYTAHYYLWKFTKTNQMANAFWFMCSLNGVKISKEEYATLRKDASKISSKIGCKKVYCLELDKVFDSCRAAVRFLGEDISKSSYIGEACRGKIKACFKWKGDLRYHWCWFEDMEYFKSKKEELLFEEANRNKFKNAKISESKKGKPTWNKGKGIKIKQVETEKIFSSYLEACKEINGNFKALKKACLNNLEFKGFHWEII